MRINTQPSLISVIIPTFNEADLPIAIESIVNQTYTNLEILVVDDQSTDNTEEVVKQYTQKDPRVKYLRNPYHDLKRTDIRGTNIGVGYLARNYGMDHARGEWITFQDADDASLSNRIEIQHELAQRYEAVCVTVDWQKYDDYKLGKCLDTERIFREHPDIMVPPAVISKMAQETRGPLMKGRFPHHYVPFLFKKRWPTRTLFLKSQIPYPGADNSPLFKREVAAHVRFRSRDEREWPSLGGRGVGRDHLFQIAEKYNQSYSFKLPLYLWRQAYENPAFAGYEKYLI